MDSIQVSQGSEAIVAVRPTKKVVFVGKDGKDAADVVAISIEELRDELTDRIIRNEASITLTSTLIQLKVDRSEFDANGVLLANFQTLINQTAYEILLKASQYELDLLTGRVTTAEASISVTANLIALKANKSDLDAVTGRLTIAESAILQTAYSISLKVSQQSFNEMDQRVRTQRSLIAQSAEHINLIVTDANVTKDRLLVSESAILQNANQIVTKVGLYEFNLLGERVNTTETRITQTQTSINLSIGAINSRLDGQPTNLDLTNAFNDAKNYALEQINDVYLEMTELQDELDNLDELMDGAFKDGILDEMEIVSLRAQLKLVNNEKSGLDGQYTTVQSASELPAVPKTELTDAKATYDAAYTSLMTSINDVIAIGVVSPIAAANISSKFTAYKDTIGVLTVRLNAAIFAIAQAKAAKALADSKNYTNAIMAAVNADIADVNATLQELGGVVDGTFRDGIITEVEAISLQKHINALNTEKSDVDGRYTALMAEPLLTGVPRTNLSTAKTNYDAGHVALINSINTAIQDKKTTVEETADVNSKFVSYGIVLKALASRFEEAVNAYGAAKAAAAKDAADIIISEMKTDIDQTKESITLLATKTELNTLSGSLSDAHASIGINATAITSKVSYTELNALGERVTANESSIDQTAEAIASKVSSTDFTGTKLVSLINQTAASIKISAKNLDLEGSISISSFGSSDSLITINALVNGVPDNTFTFKHANGIPAFVMTRTPEGKAVFRAYDDAGNKVFDIETVNSDAIKYITVIPSSLTDFYYKAINTSIGQTPNASELATLTANAKNNLSYVVDPDYSGYTHPVHTVYIGSDAPTVYLYNPGVNSESAANEPYRGYHVSRSKDSAFLANGWYANRGNIGVRYHAADYPGTNNQVARAALQYMQNGKIVNTVYLDIPL